MPRNPASENRHPAQTTRVSGQPATVNNLLLMLGKEAFIAMRLFRPMPFTQQPRH